jgi:glucan phosphoethanolaminetransferase (alkaline phosphatase superfamily)
VLKKILRFLLSFLVWQLYCLSFLDFGLLITPWLFSNLSKTSQSDTSYTTVYAAVKIFVVTALICVIIVLAILRYDIIGLIIVFNIFSEHLDFGLLITPWLFSNLSKQYQYDI